MARSILIALALSGCTVPDGDLAASAALLKMQLEASTDTLDQRKTRVSGDVTVGYTSGELLDLEILDNGISVYSSSLSVEKGLKVPVDVEVGLLFEELNNLTVTAVYNDDTITTSLPVTVPSSLQDFTLIPAALTVDELAIDVSGTAELGFVSDQQAVLTLIVNGESVATRSLPADATSLSFNELLPLDQEGINTVEGQISYAGNALAASAQVTVPPGIESLTLIEGGVPNVLTTTVSGTASLGYTAPLSATLDIYVEGELANSIVFAGDDTAIAFDVDVALPHPGDNEIVAQLSYGEVTLADSYTIAVPDSILSFDVNPSNSASDVFWVQVTGGGTVGYMSAQTAVLDIEVDGQTVLGQNFDMSTSTNFNVDEPIGLFHVGDNEVVATMTYDGVEFRDTFTVTVTPPAPTVTLPSWNTSFNPGVELTASGIIEVVPSFDYVTEAVRFSIDGGITWADAVEVDPVDPLDNDWSVTVVNPDILDEEVLFSVDSVNRGYVVNTLWVDPLPIQPIFDCTDGGSMVPQTLLIQDLVYEDRTMAGYFGDPLGNHSISFAITANADDQGPATVVGRTIRYGRFGIEVEFFVDEYQCNNCNTQPYDLEVFVEGGSFCQRNNFGLVEEL